MLVYADVLKAYVPDPNDLLPYSAAAIALLKDAQLFTRSLVFLTWISNDRFWLTAHHNIGHLC